MAGAPERDKDRMKSQAKWDAENVRSDRSRLVKKLHAIDFYDDSPEEHF